MSNDVKIAVVFCCANCGAGYQATQNRAPLQSFGSFNCQVCGIEVFSWQGDYNYVGWSVIETTPTRF